jgi:hypothetical protein
MMSPVRLSRWLAGVGFVACAVVLAGCGSAGPKRYGVSGTVKYKGEPIKNGSITFQSKENGNSGAAITNGEYTIPATAGLVPGNYTVSISYPDPKAPRPKEGEPPGKTPPAKESLPPKYNTKSELKADIEAIPMNDKNFDLK